MGLDEALAEVLAEQIKHPQCKSCKLVRDGKVSNGWLIAKVADHQTKLTCEALKRAFGDEAPSADALRKHLDSHVA